jgi:hypothetical protein
MALDLVLLDIGAEILKELTRLVEVLFTHLGPWGTIGVFVGLTIISSAWKLSTIRRKDREVNLVIQEKERTIERLTEDLRYYRAVIFKEKFGWTDEQIDRLVLKNEPQVLSSKKVLLEKRQDDKSIQEEERQVKAKK